MYYYSILKEYFMQDTNQHNTTINENTDLYTKSWFKNDLDT